MDEDFSSFLHSQFSQAQDAIQSPQQISELLIQPEARYINKEPFTEGGQKLIFKCTDALTGRSIAYATVKDPKVQESIEKFIREARLTAHLEHPHIIPVYDSGIDENGLPFFTMKLISGITFEDYLKQEHLLTAKIDILIKCCEALNFAHSKGIVHFDIKPENIQVSQFGEVLLCDWGLSGIAYESCSDELLNDELLQKVDLNQSLDSLFKGTPGYAAPEMWQKNCQRDHLADIYSIGATLGQILTGRQPQAKPQLTSLVGPDALQAVCRKALSAEKSDRYKSTADLLADLQAWRNGFATTAENAGFLTQLKLLVLRHKNVSIALLASTLLISLLTVTFIGSLSQKEQQASGLAKALQKAEKERSTLEEEQAPKYFKNAQIALDNRNYESVRALCQHILRNSESPKARRLIGLSYLCQQDFKQAATWLNGELLKLVNQYINKTPLSTTDLIAFISQLDRHKPNPERTVYKNLLFEEFAKNLSLKDKKELITAELLYKSPKLKALNLSLEETPQGLVIDLSNNKGLGEIWILQKLGPAYIKSLNLSDTPVHLMQEVLDQLHIEGLILQQWPKISLTALSGQRLHHLDVSHSKLDASNVIQGMPLITLNISHSSFTNWQVLHSLKFLKKLTVHKGQIPPQVRQKLPQELTLIEK